MKICFVTEDFYPQFIGGQGVYGYHLVDQLSRMGHQVVVLAENREGRKKFWEMREIRGIGVIRVMFVPFCFGNQLLLALWEYLIFSFKLSKEYFDILHASGLSGLFFVLFKPKNVGKVVISEWNTYAEKQQVSKSILKKVLYKPLIFLEKILYSRADGIIFDSPKEMENFAQFFSIDKPQRGIYLGQDRVSFTEREKNRARISLRNRLNLNYNAKIVLYIGRLVERKRVDTLIQALNEIATSSDIRRTPRNDKFSDVYGVIVGDGPERKKLESMASGNTSFLGWDEDIRKYYLAADLFVTVSEAEGGFLLTALEAASYGLPLILSPSAAGFPIIKEGINGFVVNPDSKELADKIKRVIGEIGVIREMGKESRKIARQFSWEK